MCRVHRGQSQPACWAGGGLLQSARHGGEHIKEGKNAINWTRLSCHGFRNNEVRLQLHALAYNLGKFLRILALPDEIEHWSMTTMREKLIKIDVTLVEVHGLIHGVCAGDDCFPNFGFGLANQRIIDATERSIESRSGEVVCTE